MSSKYLVRVSALMIAVAIAGLAAFGALRSVVPTISDRYDWLSTDDAGKSRTAAEQRAIVETLAAKITGSASIRFVSGRTDRLTEELAEMRAGKLQPDAVWGIRNAIDAGRIHATVAMILYAVLLVCGLFGLLRLRVRHMVLAGNSISILAVLGGGAILGFTNGGAIAALTVVPLMLGFFGQLVASNLLPGADHPFVVAAERELLALPPALRARRIAKRLVIGLVITVVGLAATAASIAIGGHTVVVAGGAIAGGLAMMTTPLIATARIRVRNA